MNRIRSRMSAFHHYKNYGVEIMRCPIPMNAVESGILQCSGIYFLCALSDEGEDAYMYRPDSTPVTLSTQNIPWSTSYEYQ